MATKKTAHVHHNVGKSVRQIRLTRRLSQEELAKRAHLSRSYISGLEAGKRNPSSKTLIDLAAALRTAVSDLLSASHKPGPQLASRPLKLQIARLRRKRGMTQAALARAAGIHRSY